MASCAFLHFGWELYTRYRGKNNKLRLDTTGEEGLPSAVLSPGYASSLPVRSPNANGGGKSSPLLNMAQDGQYGGDTGALGAAAEGPKEAKVTWKLLLLIGT